MSLSVCPAATVQAPVEVVWRLLQPNHLSRWADGRVVGSVPEGPPFVGQTFSFELVSLMLNQCMGICALPSETGGTDGSR